MIVTFETYPFLSGNLTVFYTEAGLRFVSLADNPTDEYRAWFGDDELVAGNRQYGALVQAYLSGKPLPDFDADWQGTPLQESVWQTLRTVPRGETWTYKKLADTIGRPAAVRAVASAVGKNPLLVFAACHRIVRSDGTLGNYRAGTEWKAQLLALEQHAED